MGLKYTRAAWFPSVLILFLSVSIYINFGINGFISTKLKYNAIKFRTLLMYSSTML